ncbi:MAG: Gfo/Idh/MocA family protein [Lachnospiraceae bacterium]|jgi:predicted dehydrogenase
MIRSLLVGRGYWGTILERYLSETGFDEVGVFSRTGGKTLKEMISDSKAEAVFICTPVSTHYEYVKEALETGAHVFCEKMLTDNEEKMNFLFRQADEKNKILFTDYIYQFSPSIGEMKKRISSLGEIVSIDAQITQKGKLYKDTDVLGNIGVHMLSVVGLMTDYSEAYSIDECRVNASNDAGPMDLHLKMRVKEAIVGIRASIVSEEKTRKINVVCREKQLSFDMMNRPSLVITQNDGRKQGMFFDEGNNLKAALESFRESIESGECEENRRCCEYIEKMVPKIRKNYVDSGC